MLPYKQLAILEGFCRAKISGRTFKECTEAEDIPRREPEKQKLITLRGYVIVLGASLKQKKQKSGALAAMDNDLFT